MFNEITIMIFNYHMIIFSDFCYNQAFQFSMGYVYAGILALLVIVNLGHMIVKNVEVQRRKDKIEELKRGYVARLD